MRKILKEELMVKVKKCGFDLESTFNLPVIRPYHYHEWDHGYYSCCGYNGTRREFYKDLEEMVDFLYEYMRMLNVEEVIIAPLHKYNIFAWQGNMKNDNRYSDLYLEVMGFLKKNNIRKNSQSGVLINIEESRKIIEMIIEGAYRYVSELCFFFPSESVIIEPTHHFDFIFFTKDFEKQKSIIKQILKKQKNIIYYENFPTFN